MARVIAYMQSAEVTVPWEEGLHLRQAVELVKVARRFHSTIRLNCEGRRANLRSIISVLTLCATVGAAIRIEVSGEDEQEAAQCVEQVFLS